MWGRISYHYLFLSYLEHQVLTWGWGGIIYTPAQHVTDSDLFWELDDRAGQPLHFPDILTALADNPTNLNKKK